MLRLLTGMDFPGAPDAELQAQPVGFDLTVRSVAAFRGLGALDLSNKKRRLPEHEPLAWETAPGAADEAQAALVRLEPGGYLVTYNEEIHVPDDCAGLVLPRSSLMRCGATLHSALWDPGYCGRGQGLLTAHHRLTLYRDARIAQFVLISIESTPSELYQGQYQGENL